MRRRLLAASQLAWLLFFAGASAAEPVLRFVEHAETDATHVHGGTGKDNVGDILTFANPVYDADDKRQVGSDQGYCVRVLAGKSYECHWTLVVQGGQITVDGPFHDDGDSLLAITGGTGIFSGASGQMLLHARDGRGAAYDFSYALERK